MRAAPADGPVGPTVDLTAAAVGLRALLPTQLRRARRRIWYSLKDQGLHADPADGEYAAAAAGESPHGRVLQRLLPSLPLLAPLVPERDVAWVLLGLCRLSAAGALPHFDRAAAPSADAPEAAAPLAQVHCVLAERLLRRAAELDVHEWCALTQACACIQWAAGAEAAARELAGSPELLGKMLPDELCSILESLSRCGAAHAGVLSAAGGVLLELLNPGAEPCIATPGEGERALTPRNLVSAVWSFAAAGNCNNELLLLCGDRLSRIRGDRRTPTDDHKRMPKKNSATNKVRRHDFYWHFVEHRCDIMFLEPSDVSRLLWSYAVLDFFHEPLLQAVVAETVQDFASFSTSDLAVAAWAFGRLKYYSPEYFRLHAERATELLEEFSQTDLEFLLWGYARLSADPLFTVPSALAEDLSRRAVAGAPAGALPPKAVWAIRELGCAALLPADAAAALPKGGAVGAVVRTSGGALVPASPSQRRRLRKQRASLERRVANIRAAADPTLAEEEGDQLDTIDTPIVESMSADLDAEGARQFAQSHTHGEVVSEWRSNEKRIPRYFEHKRQAGPWYTGPKSQFIPSGGLTNVASQPDR